MTVFLPLEASTPLPPAPHFLVASSDSSSQLHKVIKAILKAKRIVVVCGAGISVRAGIPDFRSPEGLFHTLKRDNPKESLSSGKDLFDAAVFSSEHTTSLFYQMIGQLSVLSKAAEPTSFHNLLRTLDDRGRLLRVYTQNIDAIESKCGLSFGVPDFVESKRGKGRSSVKSKPVTAPGGSGGEGVTASSIEDVNGLGVACDSSVAATTSTSQLDVPTTTTDPLMPTPSQSESEKPPSSSQQQSQPQQPHRFPSPPVETPRCIPLHGTLQAMHCQICTNSFPLEDFLPNLTAGQPPACPKCLSIEESRQQNGKRARGIGKLRPSVVLYNENHKDGEGVGEVVRKDLMGLNKERDKGNGKVRGGAADLLLVVGTSLRVPGTKKIVRMFSKAVKSKGCSGNDGQNGEEDGSSSNGTAPSVSGNGGNIRSIYLNLDFPVPMREWEGVFDGWVQGDAQKFAEMLHEEIERENKARELAEERKRKREEEAAATAAMIAATNGLATDGASFSTGEEGQGDNPNDLTSKPAKRKSNSAGTGPNKKRQKVTPDNSLNKLGIARLDWNRRSSSPLSPPGTPTEEVPTITSWGLSQKPKSMSSIVGPSTVGVATGSRGRKPLSTSTSLPLTTTSTAKRVRVDGSTGLKIKIPGSRPEVCITSLPAHILASRAMDSRPAMELVNGCDADVESITQQMCSSFSANPLPTPSGSGNASANSRSHSPAPSSFLNSTRLAPESMLDDATYYPPPPLSPQFSSSRVSEWPTQVAPESVSLQWQRESGTKGKTRKGLSRTKSGRRLLREQDQERRSLRAAAATDATSQPPPVLSSTLGAALRVSSMPEEATAVSIMNLVQNATNDRPRRVGTRRKTATQEEKGQKGLQFRKFNPTPPDGAYPMAVDEDADVDVGDSGGQELTELSAGPELGVARQGLSAEDSVLGMRRDPQVYAIEVYAK